MPEEQAPFGTQPSRPRAVSVSPLRGVAGGANPFQSWQVNPTDEQRQAMEAVVRMADMMWKMLNSQVPQGPDRTLAIRSLEECVFRANYAITHSGDI